MYRKTMLLCALLLLSSCGDGGRSDREDTARPSGDHVWKSQTDMLDKARAVEDTVIEQSVQQRQRIDELAR